MNQIQTISKKVVFSILFLIFIPCLLMAGDKETPEQLSLKGPRLLTISKTADFTITVFNSGDTASKSTRIHLFLPKNLKCIAASLKGVVSESKDKKLTKISWEPGEVEPGSKKEIIFRVRPEKIGSISMEAAYTDSTTTSPVKVTSAVRIIGVPHISISTYDTEDPVAVGENTTYVLEVMNDGSSPCTNVKIEYQIPEQMKFVSAKTQPGLNHTTEGNLIKFSTYPILNPGQKIACRITCNVIDVGSADGKATLTFDQFENPLYDIEGTSCYR